MIFAGALAPWASSFGTGLDSSDDEFVFAAAVVAAIALVVLALKRNHWVAGAPVLAGLVSLAVVSRAVHDPLGPFGGPGRNIQLEWGIWVALAGSIGLVLASLVLFAETAGVSVRGGRLTRVPRASGSSRHHTFAGRLRKLGERSTAALIRLAVEHLSIRAIGGLMEQVVPVRELDYKRDRIQLRVSSSKIGLRLRSVEKEPFTVEWIERSIRPGDVFYDIGANVGAYSLIAAKVTGGGARIFAFEPSPSSFGDLSRNVLLNGCADCVVPLPLALWSESGPVFFTLTSVEAGAARHQISRTRALKPLTETIVGVRLDDLVERFHLPAPTHAKIDVDGYELEVLRGAERTLGRREWQSIIIELDQRETDQNRAIKALLADAGFDAGRRLERPPSQRHPHPEEYPVAYWTFTRAENQG